jgi:hypothetical protein
MRPRVHKEQTAENQVREIAATGLAVDPKRIVEEIVSDRRRSMRGVGGIPAASVRQDAIGRVVGRASTGRRKAAIGSSAAAANRIWCQPLRVPAMAKEQESLPPPEAY